MSLCHYLNSSTIVDLDHVASGLHEGIVLDLGGVHQNLVTSSVLAILTGYQPLSILVHVQELRVNGDAVDLPYEMFVRKPAVQVKDFQIS